MTSSLSRSPTPLSLHLHTLIRHSGPLTIADYMRHCLTHPTYGYYTTPRPIFGSTGDFITSPQINPIFSELIAIWISHFVHHNLNSQPYDLIELGSGTGELLQTALPSLTQLKAKPVSTTLIDASPVLSQIQNQSLPQTTPSPTLSNALNNLPDRPTIFIAHELFDALPVHVFDRVNTKTWRERVVIAGDKPGELKLGLSPVPTPALGLLQLIPPVEEHRKVVEICPEGLILAQRLGERIKNTNGAALIVDYGGREDKTGGDSVRAISKHKEVGLIENAGECDVTADVNFDHLSHAVQKMEGVEMKKEVRQREFLLRLGAAQRFRIVAKGIIENEKEGEEDKVDRMLEKLQKDYERLVGLEDGEMGEVYKVATIVKKKTEKIAGFG